MKEAQDRLAEITTTRRKHQRNCPACPQSLNHLALFCDKGYGLLVAEQNAKAALRKAKKAAGDNRISQMQLPI